MKFATPLSAVLIGMQPGFAWSSPLLAKEGLESISVSYSDLDLRSLSGQHRLRNRLEYAAYRLCLTDASASPSPMIADPRCMAAKIDQTEQQFKQAIAAANRCPGVHVEKAETLERKRASDAK